MPRYDELKTVRKLSDRGDTNSVVHLVKEANADNLYVRKVIFGIEQPLYQGIFLREVQALYKLNNCDNIVKIISHRNMVYTDAATKVKERVGCIFLEYISGETLAKTNISRLTSKQKFKIIKQLLSAIETAHYNGIIHRDINPNNIMIDTVDAFQGGQKEIIIYSTVRSSDKSTRIGFLKSEARLNVSLSRAQSLLIIVGDLDFLNNTRIHGNKFPEIIEYIDKTDGCKITLAGVE